MGALTDFLEDLGPALEVFLGCWHRQVRNRSYKQGPGMNIIGQKEWCHPCCAAPGIVNSKLDQIQVFIPLHLLCANIGS